MCHDAHAVTDAVQSRRSSPTTARPIAVPRVTPTAGANAATACSSAGLAAADQRGKRVRMAVATALMGFAVVGLAKPAHADTTLVQPQVTHELFIDGHAPKAPDYAKLLGTTTPRDTAVQVDARTQRAFDAFEVRVTQILQRDAGSLAAGLRPLDGGHLGDAKQKELERALGDLVKELPVSVLPGDVEQRLSSLLGRDVTHARLGELGDAGADAAKDLVKRLREDHPKTFWSLAGTAAAAAVAVGYTQGTDALESLGIKPEVSTNVWRNATSSVKAKVGVELGPRLSDPRFNVGVEASHTFANGGVLRGGVNAQLAGKDITGAQVHGSFARTLENGAVSVSGDVRFDGSGKPFDARLSAGWQHDRWTTSVSTAYDFTSDRFTGSLAAGRSFDVNEKNDLDLQIRGSLDSSGNAQIGAGVTFRW